MCNGIQCIHIHSPGCQWRVTSPNGRVIFKVPHPDWRAEFLAEKTGKIRTHIYFGKILNMAVLCHKPWYTKVVVSLRY